MIRVFKDYCTECPCCIPCINPMKSFLSLSLVAYRILTIIILGNWQSAPSELPQNSFILTTMFYYLFPGESFLNLLMFQRIWYTLPSLSMLICFRLLNWLLILSGFFRLCGRISWRVSFVIYFNVYEIVGWGPHAYFQMLAESRNSLQPSTASNNSLRAQQAELLTVYIPSENGVQTAQVNSWDSSPTLDGSQNARRHWL